MRLLVLLLLGAAGAQLEGPGQGEDDEVEGEAEQPGGPRTAWEKPGCHLLGHSRMISIPDCAQFSVTTNACRGFCPSVSFPELRPSAPRPVTSLAQCCSIMEAEHVTVQTLCLEGERNITFRSATSCACYHCRKD